jgi:hypothetical protein
MSQKICSVCSEPLTDAEAEAVERDTDFVEHGSRGHLIRLAVPREADARAQEAADDAAAFSQSEGERNLAAGGVCDFCSRPLEPHHVVYVGPTIVSTISIMDGEDLGTGTVVSVDDSNWAACEICDPIVAEHDPVKLTAHVLANGVVEFPGEILAVVYSDLVERYTVFFEGNPQRKDDR